MYTEDLKMSRFRQAVFPIENRELKKFVPFALIIFITVFNFTQLRNLKDSLVLTAPESGGEVLSYLKSLVVMPTAILINALYIKMRETKSFRSSYNLVVSSFIVFFALFVFVINPNVDYLHAAPETIAAYKASFPRIQFMFPMFGNWVYSLFYVAAEMWGTVCLSVLFWQFANDNIGTHEAKRFYPAFLFFNAVATFLVGTLGQTFLKSVDAATTMIVFTGCIMLYLFKYVNDEVLTDPQFTKDVSPKTKKQKVKLTFTQSLKQLVSSPYIGYLSLLILAYGLSINMIEVSWKSVAKEMYPVQEDYLRMMAINSQITGISGMVMVFISKSILRRSGWLTCAIVTPVIIGVTGAVYFSSVLFGGLIEPWVLMAGFTSSSSFIVTFGMLGVILSKSSKYSFFDPTKEMAYIPLDYNLRISGKAAADGIGGRLGKAGSGWIQMLLLAITAGTQKDILPFLAILVTILTITWFFATIRLSALYHKALDEAEIEE